MPILTLFMTALLFHNEIFTEYTFRNKPRQTAEARSVSRFEIFTLSADRDANGGVLSGTNQPFFFIYSLQGR